MYSLKLFLCYNLRILFPADLLQEHDSLLHTQDFAPMPIFGNLFHVKNELVNIIRIIIFSTMLKKAFQVMDINCITTYAYKDASKQ